MSGIKGVFTGKKIYSNPDKEYVKEIQKKQLKIADRFKKVANTIAVKKSKAEVSTEKETKAISEWINKHIEEKHGGNSYAGAIGGRFSYNFTPTSIGEIGVIKCSCGDSFCFRELN
jgi:hypothetical protein